MRRLLNLCGWLAAAAIVAYPAVSGGATTVAPAAVVQAHDFFWDPATVQVDPGDTVRWDFSTAGMGTPHNVRVVREANGAVFHIGDVRYRQDGPDDVTFPYSGTYAYAVICMRRWSAPSRCRAR